MRVRWSWVDFFTSFIIAFIVAFVIAYIISYAISSALKERKDGFTDMKSCGDAC